MFVVLPSQTPPPATRPRVALIGNFDGFHRGHQAVVARAQSMAEAIDGSAWLVTFDPHPKRYFAPDAPHSSLADAAVERRLAAALGLDGHQTLRFDAQLATQTPQTFIQTHLIDGLQAAGVVVGHDFRFGQGRKGSADTLRADGRFTVDEVEPFVDEGGQTVSSSRIRALLRDGDLQEANGLLGYRYIVGGIVEHGEKRGRELGYPTANISLPQTSPLKHGIYATTIKVAGQVHASVSSYGRRPTFGDKPPLLEVYVFDFEGDLYGQEVEVAFHSYLRPELKFEGVDALIAQMDTDSAEARAALAAAQPLSPLDLELGLVHATAQAA